MHSFDIVRIHKSHCAGNVRSPISTLDYVVLVPEFLHQLLKHLGMLSQIKAFLLRVGGEAVARQ